LSLVLIETKRVLPLCPTRNSAIILIAKLTVARKEGNKLTNYNNSS
jgi:hypothetical protein